MLNVLIKMSFFHALKGKVICQVDELVDLKHGFLAIG